MGAPLRHREIAKAFPSRADRALALAHKAAPGLTLLLVGVPVAAGLLFTVLPAFGWLPALGGTAFSPAPFRELLAQPGIWRSAGLSLGTGLAASFLSLGLAMLVLAAFGDGRTFRRLRAALPPLLALPHAAAAFALAFLVAPSGWLFRLAAPVAGWQTPPDLLVVNDPLGLTLTLGLVLKETPFLLLVMLAALPQAQADACRKVAASLGYGPVSGFLFTAWPALYRQIRLPVLAVVAFSTAVVDMAAILGPTLPPVLSQRLVEWINDPDLSRRFLACAGAVMQLGVSLFALTAWVGLERVFAALRDRLARRGRRFVHDGVLRAAAGVTGGAGLLALGAGVTGLLVWSVAGPWPFPDLWPRTLALRVWRDVVPGLAAPLVEALFLGVASAGIALALCVLWLSGRDARRPSAGGPKEARRSKLLEAVFYLPLLVPQPAFLFGLQLVFLTLGLTPGRAALVGAHLIFVLPYVLLALAGPWAAFDRRFEQVSTSLGHGRARTFLKVRLPMLLPALLGAAAIGFAVSAGLYLPTLLVGAGRVATVTTEAVALASGSDRRVIGAVALVQALLPWAGFAIALALPALLSRGRRFSRA